MMSISGGVQVAAIFLEALVLLLHRSPELKLKEDLPEPVAQESEKALLEEVRRSNAWERFTALASNSPRQWPRGLGAALQAPALRPSHPRGSQTSRDV